MAMFLFRNLNNDLNTVRPSQLLDQHFGLGLTPEELLNSLVHPHGSNGNMLRSPGYYRPWKLTRSDNGSTLKFNKDAFQVNLDVQQFLPEEINVKSSGNSIIVEAKHDEREDEHGFISRSFIRKYILPEGHDINGVVSSLSSDGILTITAPKIAEPKSVERIIPITQTGPHKKVQEDEKSPEENQE